MTITRAAVVVNPTRVRDIGELRHTMTVLLSDIGEPPWLETTPEDPGTGKVRSALAEGADLVLAYGGDGTHRACAATLAGTDVPLALIPAGTGNLLARRLGVPNRLDRAVEVSLHGESRSIDICHAGVLCACPSQGPPLTLARTDRGDTPAWVPVPVDLANDWEDALLAAGFDPLSPVL